MKSLDKGRKGEFGYLGLEVNCRKVIRKYGKKELFNKVWVCGTGLNRESPCIVSVTLQYSLRHERMKESVKRSK